ncbi:Flavoprotein-like [Moorella glycerini]|uniref:Iron-sulfur flavoprotein n=1 Tax=Neomoorella stamsii TaxID=1266720 RepID=A0A9X7P4N8_9FIRM|nr:MULTISPECIES: flavodoxin family protein [Moorella]PRR68562.1 Iron-sulfur flavoprotein [Moorella stamsii]CEP66114.1 Flavoprotein-like [Moorella glycerini]
MKAVGFVGSPRRGGNTEILVEQVLAGAAASGAKTAIYHLNELHIRGCQGCNYCQEHGYCRQEDDMTILYEQLKAADGIVLGSPIYMGYLTAQTKLFLDRLFALFKVGVGCLLPPGKRGVLVYSQGSGDDAALMENLARWFTTLMGIEIKGVVGGNGMNELGAVRLREDLLAEAFRLGQELV